LIFSNKILKQQQPTKISLGLLVFTGLSIISLLWSVNRYGTLLSLIPLLLAGYLYLVCTDFLKDKKMIGIWMPIWIAASTIIALAGVPEFITSKIDGRYSGLIGWPNAFAGYIIAPFLLSSYMYTKSKSKYSYLYLMASGVMFSTFILTFSRAAFLIMGILIALYILIYFKNKDLIKSLVISLLIGAFLAGGLYFVKNNIFKNTANNNITSSSTKSSELLQSSLADRKSYWLSSVSIYRDNLFIGTGLGTFKSVYPKYQRNASAETNYPHSYFLETLTEVGIIGGVILLALVIYLLKLLFKNKKSLISICALAAIGIIGHSFLDNDLSYPAILFTLIMLLSIISVSVNDSLNINQKIIHYKKVYKYFILFLAIGLSYLSYLHFQAKSLSNAIILNSTDNRSVIYDLYNDLNKSSFNNPKNLNSEANLILQELSDQNKNQNLNKAESLVNKSLLFNTTNGYTYFLLAEIDYFKGDKKAAKLNIEKSIQKDPYNNPRAYLLFSRILAEEDNKQEAISNLNIISSQYDEQTINKKIGFNPGLRQEIANIYLYKGLLQISLGNKEEAKISIKKSIDLSPNNYAESILKTL